MGVVSLVGDGVRFSAVVSLWKSWPVREERHDRANGPGPARSGVGSRLRSLLSRAERLLSLKSFQHMSDAILMRSIWCAYPHARQRMHARLCGERCAALGSTRSMAAPGLASERSVARLASHPLVPGRSEKRLSCRPWSLFIVRRVCYKRIALV